MSETKTAELSHAEANAAGWLSTIREYAAALSADRERLEELRDERESLVDPDDNPADARTVDEWDASEEGQELAELTAAVTIDGEELDEESLRERIQESPISVEVRSGWCAPGARDELATPEEYMILLSTGGPALRIVGDLDNHMCPTSARLEHQDWFKPWSEFITTGDDHDALMSFVGQFYFGE